MKKLVLLGIIIILTACGSDLVAVEYKDEMKIDDQTITIEGTTDLQEGSIITYEVKNFDDVDFFEEGTAEVQDGSFSFSLDVSDYESGEYEIYYAFLPYLQTEDIQEVYGEMGENLQTSSEVTYSEMMDDVKLIENWKTFEKN